MKKSVIGKLPKSVKVGHRNLKVVLDPSMADYHGKFDSDAGEIRLDPNKIDPVASLLHEMVHAALDVSGVACVLKNDDLEEAICVAIEMLMPNFTFIVKK